jgi:hypothetical protein
VGRHETSIEEFVFCALFGIVLGCTFIFCSLTADVFCWRFFHRDYFMTHYLLYETNIDRFNTQVLASDSSGIHTATILAVGAKLVNARLLSDNLTIGVRPTVFDAIGHGLDHQAWGAVLCVSHDSLWASATIIIRLPR